MYGFVTLCAFPSLGHVHVLPGRSSDGLSLFVSSTDGYVSKIHFAQGELGITIPESEVPQQTRRLHPVIYNWQPEISHEAACRLPKPLQVDESPTPREKGGETVGTGDAPSAPMIATKLKKKIVPTLVTSGLRPPVDVELVRPSTAVPPSPNPPSAERKKRRITPILVDSNRVDANAYGADEREENRGVPGTQDVSSSSPVEEDAPQPLPSATSSSTGQDRTPKKKRLAPTLVSAL